MNDTAPNKFAVWLYAIFRSGGADLLDATGVSGENIRAISHSDLTAAVGSVPLAEFGEDRLKSRLRSLQSAETVARSHHNVIARISDRTTAIPARLGTMYRDDGSVESMLQERHRDLAAALRRLARCTEWGIRLYAAAPPPGSTPTDAVRSGSGPITGTEYLQRRRTERESAAQRQRLAGAQASAVHAILSAHAAGARSYPPQPPQLTGENRGMILNATYLIPDDGAADFADIVESLRRRYDGIELDMTGPWPPYSFTGVSDAEVHTDG